MTIHSVRSFLAEKAPDIRIVELKNSTATVELAAQGHGVVPAQIAKTLSLRVCHQNLLMVIRGDARLDNKNRSWLSAAKSECSVHRKSRTSLDIRLAEFERGACLRT
jgi:prolyl-tRNA editing enzyme YbaK/EbsC (Cys-tRNA(Pro) deacylase)